MNCPHCGKENMDGAAFCTGCGTPITGSGNQAVSGPDNSAMTYKDVLFSFKGRIPRSTYWLKFALPFGIIFIVLSLLIDPTLNILDSHSREMISVFLLIFYLTMLYPCIAVAIKRAHDRDRSGWFILLLFVPIVSLWPTIELGFIKGTTGANTYGSDPLAAS